MYILKCDGMSTVHKTVKAAKREGDALLRCGAYDVHIYCGNIAYASRKCGEDWKRIYHTPARKRSYDADRVKEAYAEQHPDREVLRVYKDRSAALRFAAAESSHLVDLSYGFYIVTSAPA